MSPRIQKVSFVFRYLFLFVFITLPILHITLWLFAPDNTITLADGSSVMRVIPEGIAITYQMGFFTKLLACIIDAIPLIVMELIFFWLIRLFMLYEKAEIFSLANVGYIKKIGYALIALQLVKPITEGLLTAALTWQNPAGQGLREMRMSFNGMDLSLLAVGFLVILVSWIMAEGVRLREDQQLTI